MGARKRLAAEKKRREKTTIFCCFTQLPYISKKMRLVADMIRGMEVNKALDVLKYSSKEASRRVEKLLLSALPIGRLKTKEFV